MVRGHLKAGWSSIPSPVGITCPPANTTLTPVSIICQTCSSLPWLSLSTIACCLKYIHCRGAPRGCPFGLKDRIKDNQIRFARRAGSHKGRPCGGWHNSLEVSGYSPICTKTRIIRFLWLTRCITDAERKTRYRQGKSTQMHVKLLRDNSRKTFIEGNRAVRSASDIVNSGK